MIRSIKGVSGSALGVVLASAGALLLRKRFPPKTSQEQRREAFVAIELLRIKLGFPREVFERAVRPVIEGYAKFVQLPPAPGSQLGDPEELFTRALELANRALDYRRGQILPRGAAPEAIGAQAHRWSYGVFVAALLCDLGKNMLDGSDGRAAKLLDRFVPPSVLEWLAADPALMNELLAFLSGARSAQAGAVGELVLRAAAESERRDLLPCGNGDPAVQHVPPLANPRDAKAAAGAAATLNTVVAAQQDSSTLAPGESTDQDEEPEYLEDIEEEHPTTDQKILAADPVLAQAPDAARLFIGWVQQGLSEGTLRVNQAGALVHFVDEGMLLVSPRIFREYAKRFSEDGGGGPESDPGKSIQRQVLRAGWHLRADKGVNILTYQVMQGKRALSRLSGVVIRKPARFVNPVPPINPLLVRLREEQADA